MAIYMTFEAGKDEDFGTMGWTPCGMADANAIEARGMAHDMLEHRATTAKEPAANEMQALGAILYIRGYTGELTYRSSYRSMTDIIAGDVCSIILRGWRYKDQHMPTYSGPARRVDEYVTRDVCTIVHKGIAEAYRELRGFGELYDAREFAKDRRQWQRNAELWMIDGYVRAERYWRKHGLDEYGVAGLFNILTDELKKRLPVAYGEGQFLRVGLDLHTAKVSICEHDYFDRDRIYY